MLHKCVLKILIEAGGLGGDEDRVETLEKLVRVEGPSQLVLLCDQLRDPSLVRLHQAREIVNNEAAVVLH